MTGIPNRNNFRYLLEANRHLILSWEVHLIEKRSEAQDTWLGTKANNFPNAPLIIFGNNSKNLIFFVPQEFVDLQFKEYLI
jgi:hypothetical protein